MLTVQVIAFIAGSVFILIAIIDGGFTVKELKIPTVPKTGRIISGHCRSPLYFRLFHGSGSKFADWTFTWRTFTQCFDPA